jgi:hypothetical protein
MAEANGDIWDVPPVPHSEFPAISRDVWREAEALVNGYPGKCRDVRGDPDGSTLRRAASPTNSGRRLATPSALC